MSRFQHIRSLFNAPFVHLKSVDSTNNYAAKLLKDGDVAHGTVILADEQKQGKGQRGRKWESSAGLDLTISLVLKPKELSVDKQFNLSHIAALSIKDTLEHFGLREVAVKWPNDVLVADRKIAGILIECGLTGDRLEHVIVGVGINIGTTDFGDGLNATSLKAISGVEADRLGILQIFLERFEKRYLSWSTDDYANITVDGTLWKQGVWTDFLLDGGSVEAKPLSVNGSGEMVLEMKDGTVKAFGTSRLRHDPHGDVLSD